MSRIAIVTDSAAAIAPATAASLTEAGGFAVVPMPVSVYSSDGAERELSGLNEQQVDEAILMAHVQGDTVRTSGPAPGAFRQVYDSLFERGYTQILSIHLSGELSGTVAAAKAGAKTSRARVSVIDSRTVAGGYGYAVQCAHQLAQQRVGAGELEQAVHQICAATKIFCYIPTLEALRRGGRVSPALAMVGQMFQIKPIGTVCEGKLIYVERPRTAARAKERLVALTQQACGAHRMGEHPRVDTAARFGMYPAGAVVGMHHCGNAHEAEHIRTQLGAVAADAVLSSVPPVLAAHSGLGALATIIY